jgi:hypothetical protein
MNFSAPICHWWKAQVLALCDVYKKARESLYKALRASQGSTTRDYVRGISGPSTLLNSHPHVSARIIGDFVMSTSDAFAVGSESIIDRWTMSGPGFLGLTSQLGLTRGKYSACHRAESSLMSFNIWEVKVR